MVGLRQPKICADRDRLKALEPVRVKAMAYLKKYAIPIPRSHIFKVMKVKGDSDKASLIRCLLFSPKIRYISETQSLEYIFEYNIASAVDILEYLINHPGSCIRIRKLKERWPGCMSEISELQKEGKILVMGDTSEIYLEPERFILLAPGYLRSRNNQLQEAARKDEETLIEKMGAFSLDSTSNP